MATVLIAIVGCTVICCFCIYQSMSMVNEERKQVYVLDGDIPFLAKRTQAEEDFAMEARAHIQLFHHYFFTLPPDDSYIKWTLGKAMYMADGTAVRQKRAMDEAGFFSDIVASSAVCTIVCDSIQLDEQNRSFKYFGTQYIQRRTNSVKRSLITVGKLVNVPRTENNPHGLLITNWKTLENKDLL